MGINLIKVEVAYAMPEKQEIITLYVPPNSTIRKCIELANLPDAFSDIESLAVGIFSKRKKLSDTIQAFDRIEIYRPLLIDPKQARLLRARSS